MIPNWKEWIVNGLLLAAILGFAGLTVRDRLQPAAPSAWEAGQAPPAAPRVAAQSPDADTSPTLSVPLNDPPSETSYNPQTGLVTVRQRPGADDRFPALGKLNVFRDLVTPTPTPTPAPPAAAPTPSLERITKNWQYQYPIRRKNLFVFQDNTNKMEFQLEEGVPREFPDLQINAKMAITAKSKGKFGVTLEGAEQSRDFDLK